MCAQSFIIIIHIHAICLHNEITLKITLTLKFIDQVTEVLLSRADNSLCYDGRGMKQPMMWLQTQSLRVLQVCYELSV